MTPETLASMDRIAALVGGGAGMKARFEFEALLEANPAWTLRDIRRIAGLILDMAEARAEAERAEAAFLNTIWCPVPGCGERLVDDRSPDGRQIGRYCPRKQGHYAAWIPDPDLPKIDAGKAVTS